MDINANTLVTEGRDQLSLMARMTVSRSTLEKKPDHILMRLDATGWEALRIPRIRTEIEAAVKKIYGMEVRLA